MIKLKTKFHGKKITLRGTDKLAPGFGARQHAQLGQIGLNSLKKRVSKGIGADDQPMPPLSDTRSIRVIIGQDSNRRGFFTAWKGYLTQKVRKGGKRIRNLRSANKGDHMMDNLSVRSASDRDVKIDFTVKRHRIKALKNQERAEFLGWSPNDKKTIMKAARRMFRHEVTATQEVLVHGGRKRRTFTRNTAQFARRAA